MVSHFFVQDESSKLLLLRSGLSNVSVSGDTRFDRVAENADSPKVLNEVKNFCEGANVFIAGSTWPDDEKLIKELITSYPEWRFIIAPHEIKEDKLRILTETIGASSVVKYSDLKSRLLNNEKIPQVLVVDNVGMLSSIYQYGHISYIGGGFGVGIHNTLEAAAFGIPVIFGPNYTNFIEAKALINIGAGFSINNAKELLSVMKELQNEQKRVEAGTAARNYVQQERGATDMIMEYVDRYLKQ
jgi:3-deoxy-D-manno-octulosonic-acid transferase